MPRVKKKPPEVKFWFDGRHCLSAFDLFLVTMTIANDKGIF